MQSQARRFWEVVQHAAGAPSDGRGQGDTDKTRDGRDDQEAGQRDILGTGVDGTGLGLAIVQEICRSHDAEITIGYTDMRTPGKAHEEYYRLVQERGVRYVRGRVGEILEEQDGSLTVRMENTMTGAKSEDQYDLVVLSAGLEAVRADYPKQCRAAREIAEALGPKLWAEGLLVVGLDVIGPYLTEVNVTSPTCFVEIATQTGFDVGGMFADALVQAVGTGA